MAPDAPGTSDATEGATTLPSSQATDPATPTGRSEPGSSTTGAATGLGTSASTGTGPFPETSTGASPGICDGATRTVFINFDGPTIVEGPQNDPAKNICELPDTAGRWSRYDGNDTASIVATVADAFAPFDVCITSERPNGGTYNMVIVTVDEHSSGALAYGDQDCGNANADLDIGFVFEPLIGYSATAKGYVIASLIGGMFGLSPVEAGADDIMKVDVETNDTGLSFSPTCYALDVTSLCLPTTCSGQQQSSANYLAERIGEAR